MLIINCAGTFNKRFDTNSDKMKIFHDNKAIEEILKNSKDKYHLERISFKDTLQVTDIDIKLLIESLHNTKESIVIILHELLTIIETSKTLSKMFNNKRIILMEIRDPFEIDKIASSLSIGISIGFAKASIDNGTYICKDSQIKKL